MENIESKMGWVMVVDNSESLMIAIHYIKKTRKWLSNSIAQNETNQSTEATGKKRKEKRVIYGTRRRQAGWGLASQ